MKNWIKKNKLPLIILIILVLITYVNSSGNEFLSDDIAEIAQNPRIGTLSYIFEHPFGFIRLILYAVVYHIFGLIPFGFRLINFFFHTGNVILVFALLSLFPISKKIAFFTAAIFAVSPTISEAVVWISGGGYPQYTFFFLLSFIFYILSGAKKKYYILSVITFVCSFLSHPQMPVSLFLIFPLYEFCFGNLKKYWLKSIPYFIASCAFIGINLHALPEREQTLENVHYQEKGIDNIFILIPTAFLGYFFLIFFPKDLTLYHSELFLTTLTLSLGVLIVIIYLSGIIISFFKSKFIFFWLSFTILAISPTLTPFRLNWIVAERYLYLPILGIIVIAVYLLKKVFDKLKIKNLDIFIFGIIILILMTRTIVRNIDWKNQDNLWIASSITSPSSPNNHNNLGDMYGRWGDKQKAIQEFKTAILLKPNYADAYHNLGNAYREIGDNQKALESYQKAATINPNLWQSHQNMAAIYYIEQKYDSALEEIQKAIQINPSNINLVNNLGVLYLLMGDKQSLNSSLRSEYKEKAKQIFQAVLKADPQNQVAQQGLVEAEK